MTAWYNENDEHVADWLENLIAERLIAPGVVDRRSIRDVRATDLVGFTQCHFFAGIGGWSLALRLADWPDDRPVWTGSCPCQPFSIGGKVGGVNDERHLWPEWFRLIRERAPAIVFGEQVASKAGYGWLAGVHLEMESADYSFGAANLCAASVQAKHPRQRIFFVAHAGGARLARPISHREGVCRSARSAPAEHDHAGIRERIRFEPNPGTLVRVDGLPRPVVQARGFGNAIVPQVAAEFVMAALNLHDRVGEK